MATKKIYIPYKVFMWKGQKVQNPLVPSQTTIKPLPEFGFAFQPVFDSLDELLEHFPDAEYFESSIDMKQHQNLNA